MKKWVSVLLLCLLLAGCQTPAEQESCGESSSAESSSHTSSHTSSITEISLPEDFSDLPSQEITLPETPEPMALRGVLLFTFPEGWQNDGDDLFAVSPGENASVQGSFTPLATMQGLTGEMLASSTAPALQKAWEDAGATGVTGEVKSFTLGGIPCAGVALQGVLEGTAVFQWQIYLPLEDGYLTVTITSYDQDIRTDLLRCFSAL